MVMPKPMACQGSGSESMEPYRATDRKDAPAGSHTILDQPHLVLLARIQDGQTIHHQGAVFSIQAENQQPGGSGTLVGW
jgi:hypothetical protein